MWNEVTEIEFGRSVFVVKFTIPFRDNLRSTVKTDHFYRSRQGFSIDSLPALALFVCHYFRFTLKDIFFCASYLYCLWKRLQRPFCVILNWFSFIYAFCFVNRMHTGNVFFSLWRFLLTCSKDNSMEFKVF